MKKQLILSLILLVLVGCAAQQVPKSQITWDLTRGTGYLSLPKDAEIVGLDVSVSTGRVVHVKIQKLIVKTNPEVIGSSGEATSKVIDATARAFQQGIDSAAKAMVKP